MAEEARRNVGVETARRVEQKFETKKKAARLMAQLHQVRIVQYDLKNYISVRVKLAALLNRWTVMLYWISCFKSNNDEKIISRTVLETVGGVLKWSRSSRPRRRPRASWPSSTRFLPL